MGKELLKREVKAIALARMEDAARTVDDFQNVVSQWDHNYENDARKYRDHEIGRDEKTMNVGYSDGQIFPIPFIHYAWRQVIKGDFLDFIFDTAEDIWQIPDDKAVIILLKELTRKQKEVLFLSAIRHCTPQQIACYQDKTDRAIRKLLTATLERLQNKLAPIIQNQIAENSPDVTFAKRQFIARQSAQQKFAIDNANGE